MSNLLATVTQTQQRFFEFARLPGRWSGLAGLLLIGMLCYGVLWMYRREARAGAGPRLRAALALLRCAALVALAVVWLQPVLATDIIRTITAQVVVLVDESASMWIADGADAPPDPRTEAPSPGERPSAAATRLARVEALLSDDRSAFLRKLAQRNELALFAFGERTERLPLPAWPGPTGAAAAPSDAATRRDPAPMLLDRPAQPATDAGQALAAAVEAVGDSAVAGVILISDGAFNHGMSPDEVVAYAARMRAPVYAVGVGLPSEPPNVRVAGVSAPATVARGDPFEVRVELAAEAIEPTEVTVELIAWPISGDQTPAPSSAPGGAPADDLPAGARLVATRSLRLGAGASGGAGGADGGPGAGSGSAGSVATAAFELREERPGEYLYRARLGPLPGEVVLVDNVGETAVEVLETRLRVLLVAGGPTYDARFVARLYERDKTIDVSCWLQSADERAVREGDVPISALPREPEELFGYDVVLLMDPNPRDLDSGFAVTLRRFVDEFGGGLLYQAGRHYATRFLSSPALEDLRAVLPVVVDPDASVKLSEQGNYHTRTYPVQIPDESITHPLLALADDAQTTRRIWDALPGVVWHLPVARAKPVATVLMQHGDPAQRTPGGPAILLATQPFGSGRTVFLAHDTTWRWRGPAEPLFNRFWVQLARYLGQNRRQGAGRRGAITIDRSRIDVGEPFTIEARVLGESYAPWHEPEIPALIDLPDGRALRPVLRAVPGREGWFSARAVIDSEGLAVIRVPLPGSNRAAEELSLRVRAHRRDVEMRSLRQRVEVLQKLAQQTGGEYVPLEQARNLPERIEPATEFARTRGPDEDLWDRWWTLALIATLLSVEWTLRRRNHLL